MITVKETASKFAVAAVAVAMIFSAFAPAASANTEDDLQNMINDLLAQIAEMEAGMNDDSSMGSSDVCPYTWTRDLSTGSEGADVMKLQQFLNENPDTRVAAAGSAGSAGMETMYYGPATAAAVSKMQVAYRADILTPNGLVNPTGYFGPSTRAKANELCADGGSDNGGDDNGGDDNGGDDNGGDDGDKELSGEASLDSFEIDGEESDLEEADEDVEIATVTIEFDDGDAEISRIDMQLVADNGNDEDEPWEVFETMSLWVDGDKVEEVDIDDEDNYQGDEDDGVVRFSGLDLVGEEEEELEIVVAVTLQNNLDGVNDGETWTLSADSMRFFDADGVATTEDGSPVTSDSVDFDIDEEGADEDLDVSLSSDNPDATDIIVDTDSDTNGVEILVADLEAEDGDLDLDQVVVLLETTGASTTDVVDEIYVVFDGDEFKAEQIGGTPGNAGDIGGNSVYVDADGSDDAVWYAFDIDGDITVEEDEEIEMSVVVDLNDTDDGVRYSNGTLIKASITSTELGVWDVEGANDITPSGSAVGDEHTLVAEGIVIPAGDDVETSTDTTGQDDTVGVFTIEFDVTAVEGDFYITDAADEAATSGAKFSVDADAAPTSVSAVLTSSADEDTDDVFTVREGDTETFTLKVDVDASATGNHRVTLESVFFSSSADGVTDIEEYIATPSRDFRTDFETINQGS